MRHLSVSSVHRSGGKNFLLPVKMTLFLFVMITICQYFVDTYIMSKTLATLIKDISIISDFIVGFYLSILAFSVQWSASRVTHLIIAALLGRNTILNVVFKNLKIKYELYNTGLPKKDRTSATTLYGLFPCIHDSLQL